MNNKSYLTAITRKKLSASMKWLYTHALLQPGLDYGCGKGSDADIMGLVKYDPYYFPRRWQSILNERFNLITCIYVLNVLFPAEQVKVVKEVEDLLAPGGVAYFAVRRDVSPQGWTKRGTWQCEVLMDLPKLVENKSFCIYKMVKN
jgi:SAM-dependent methyltransferase